MKHFTRIILIFIANLSILLLLLLFLNSLQSPWNIVHSYSNMENLSPNSHSHFFSSTNKTVKHLYESGHLIANADLCPELGKNMKLMILVTSALPHSEARMAIRQTWSFNSRHHNVGVGFVLGSHKQLSENATIQTEQQTYGDLIQTRIVDSYSNLPLKTISLLEWVDSYCSQVPFVLKTDDDMFINIPLLLELLQKQQQATRSIFGQLAHERRPFREVDSKYFLSKSEYEPDTLPDFIVGPAYLMTQDLVHDLYRQALDMPFLRLEDVLITGLAVIGIGIRLIDVNKFLNDRIPFNNTRIREAISIHGITPREQILLWADMTFESSVTNQSSQAKPFGYLRRISERRVRDTRKKLLLPTRKSRSLAWYRGNGFVLGTKFGPRN